MLTGIGQANSDHLVSKINNSIDTNQNAFQSISAHAQKSTNSALASTRHHLRLDAHSTPISFPNAPTSLLPELDISQESAPAGLGVVFVQLSNVLRGQLSSSRLAIRGFGVSPGRPIDEFVPDC